MTTKTRKTWGVTLEVDYSVYGDTQEEAERLARGMVQARVGGNPIVTGSWLMKEEITETTVVDHSLDNKED